MNTCKCCTNPSPAVDILLPTLSFFSSSNVLSALQSPMGWKSHTISLSFQYYVISYHTVGIIEAFQFQSKPYHHSKVVTGCLGSFFQNMKNISLGCNTGLLGPIFVDMMFRFLLTFEATSGGYTVNLALGNLAQLGLIPGFGHLHSQ